MNSEVSICNKALRYLGAPEILSLDQSSREADLCSRHYADTRDELLESYHWNFATSLQSLARMTETPLFNYAYAYRLPTDALRVRTLRNGAPFMLVSGGIVYTDARPAEAVLTVRVTDPASFPALFVEALARRLASALALPLMGNTRLEQIMLQRFADALDLARLADAAEEDEDIESCSSWLEVR